MRYTWIFLILAILSLYIAKFLYTSQSPWNKAKLNSDLATESIETNSEAVKYILDSQELGLISDYINFRNFFALSLFTAFGITFAFSSIHTFVDKFFFKKFYEEADWKLAVRRGGMLSGLLFAFVMLRLFSGLTIFTAIPLIFLFGLIEYSLAQRARKKSDGTKIVEKHDSKLSQT